MNESWPRGFTFIELLTVVAIISILSTAVLLLVGNIRDKGKDAGIQANLHSIQDQSELYFSSSGHYSYGLSAGAGACTGGMFSDSVIASAIAEARAEAKGNTIACDADGPDYAVQAELNSSSGGSSYWCVDSSDRSRSSPTPLSGINCP